MSLAFSRLNWIDSLQAWWSVMVKGYLHLLGGLWDPGELCLPITFFDELVEALELDLFWRGTHFYYFTVFNKSASIFVKINN